MTDRMEKIIAAGKADAEAYRAEERAAVVAWLRADEAGRGLVEYRDCWNVAAMIERGDHLKDTTQTQGGE